MTADCSMLERAARAMCVYDDPGAAPCPCNGNCTGWRTYATLLPAALRALRVPDEAMLEAMRARLPAHERYCGPAVIWAAFIDSILADPSCEAQRAKQEQPATGERG